MKLELENANTNDIFKDKKWHIIWIEHQFTKKTDVQP